MIPANTLLEEAKCYLCYGVTLGESLSLALRSRIDSGQVTPGTEQFEVINDGSALISSTTGFFAMMDGSSNITIFPTGLGSIAAGAITVWPCLSAVDSTNFGSITFLDINSTSAAGQLDATLLINLTDLNISNNTISTLLVSGLSFLTNLNANNNGLNQGAVNAVLVALNNNGAVGGQCDLQVNAIPGGSGMSAKANLITKGWSVLTD